jgi:hypothetical protein
MFYAMTAEVKIGVPVTNISSKEVWWLNIGILAPLRVV